MSSDFKFDVVYDKWWHRFIPSKRREAKTFKLLMDTMIDSQKLFDQTAQKILDIQMVGIRETLILDNYEGVSPVKLAKKREPKIDHVSPHFKNETFEAQEISPIVKVEK